MKIIESPLVRNLSRKFATEIFNNTRCPAMFMTHNWSLIIVYCFQSYKYVHHGHIGWKQKILPGKTHTEDSHQNGQEPRINSPENNT
jgi:hypothetical protein